MRILSQSGAPLTLRLDQSSTPLEDGLRFQDALLRPVQVGVGTRTQNKSRQSSPSTVSITLGASIARLVFASHLLCALFLCVMMLGAIFIGVRATSNVNLYYALAEPYFEEALQRGMHMVRNADESSVSMANLMREAEGMTSSTVPALARSVNETAAMVDRLAHLARNPVLKVSVE